MSSRISRSFSARSVKLIPKLQKGFFWEVNSVNVVMFAMQIRTIYEFICRQVKVLCLKLQAQCDQYTKGEIQ